MNKLTDVFATIAKYAGNVPALKSFLEANIAKAADIVKALAAVNSGTAFHEWKGQAVAVFRATGIQAQDEWQELLLNLAWEAVKGEAQRFFLLRWFLKVKEFLVRNGLSNFLAAAFAPALAFFEAKITEPGASFHGVGDALFAYLKNILPTNKDTWIALVVNIVKIAIKSRA